MHSVPVIGRGAAAILIGLLAIALSGCGQSQSPKSAYEFSAVSTDVPMEGEAVIDVRLTKNPGGTPVENAVFFEIRFDMSPDSMSEMSAQVAHPDSPVPGVYRFAVKPTMAGRWELKLGAKVQGEAETVRGSVVVTAR
ncbi:MAG: FixH family protein [Alphaproteobacteria bacterium]|jgi:hypothetical protein